MRIPLTVVPGVDQLLAGYRNTQQASQVSAQPLVAAPPKRGLGEFAVRVPAGALGLTDDLMEDECDLHELLVRDASATYVYTVSGDSMDRAGILDGDKVLVDRGLEARNGDIVIAVLPGEGHTLKRLQLGRELAMLLPESNNPRHQPRPIRPGEDWLAWGVVTAVIRKLRSRPTAKPAKPVRAHV